MEAIFRHSSADFKNHRNIHPRFFSQPSENFAPSPSSFHGGGGLLYTPPFSFSPSLLNQRHYQQIQPPILPLPLPLSLPLPIPNSYQNTRKINNRTKHQSLSVKKSNSSVVASSKREKSKHESVKISSDSVIMSSVNNRLGPDPKDVPRVLFSANSNTTVCNDQVAKFSGSVVPTVLSPPPSSLPLPTFSLRPKLSCNAEAAAGVDAGATDNLRRMLRLR